MNRKECPQIKFVTPVAKKIEDENEEEDIPAVFSTSSS